MQAIRTCSGNVGGLLDQLAHPFHLRSGDGQQIQYNHDHLLVPVIDDERFRFQRIVDIAGLAVFKRPG